MKVFIVFLLAGLTLSNTISAQNPFARGTLSFTNRPNLSFTKYKSLVNGDPRSFDFRIDPSYFIANGVAIGAELRTGSNSSENAKSSFSSWQTNFTITYGRKVTGKINAYAKIFAGPGGSHSEFDISSMGNSPQKLKATYFDLKGLIGMPLALEESGFAFFTPYISYDYYKTNTPTNDFTDKTLAFGFKLESYLGKGQQGLAKERPGFFNTAYRKGAHFLEFNTLGGVSLATRQQKQAGSTVQIAKQKNKTINLAFGYNYYVVDDIAVGINFNFNRYSSGYVGSHADATTNLMIQPVVTAQAPLEGNGQNLFLQLGYGFGIFKSPKKNITDLLIRAGYNIFLSKYLTLTPKIGYEHIKGSVPEGVSGIPYKNSGIAAELGVRTWLSFWKWR